MILTGRNRKRTGDITCRCGAYDFPHRLGGGKCNLLSIVIERFPGNYCSNCNLLNNGCEVINGVESPKECHYVQELFLFNEVKL